MLPRNRTTRSPPLLPALLALLGACGCTQVLGLEKYGPGPRRDASCSAGHAANASGTCESVGVDACDAGFTRDPRGGCAPVLPQSDCPFGGAPTAAWPGKAVCAPLTLCTDMWPADNTTLGPKSSYVLAGAAPGGDGTQAKPFGTIAAALAAGADNVLIGSGKVVENVVFDRPVHISGTCAEHTTITAADPNKPVLQFNPGASGSGLYGLEISGGADGIVANRARVGVSGSWVHDATRAGIVLKEIPDGVTVSGVDNSLVERTGERGIVVRGGDATIGSVMVRDVGAAGVSPAIGSIGIDIEPSGFVPWLLPSATGDTGADAATSATPGAVWSPSASLRSVVTVKNTLVERVLRGLVVEGSTVDISAAAVRETVRGVVARFRPEGGIPASLSLSNSTIEGSQEMGVEIWNATTTIDRTTIRPAPASCPAGSETLLPGSRLGNGIRARYDRNVTLDSPRTDRSTTLERSVIGGASQAAIHMEGGFLVVDHSIVEGTAAEGCSSRFGDGITAYSYDFSPATVKVVTSRIAGSSRAGIATFGADVDVQGASLDCNARGVVRAATTAKVTGAPSCGCDGPSAPCGVEVDASLARSVISADCEGGSELDCSLACFDNFFQPGAVVKGVTVETLDVPRVAPAVTDEFGCAPIGGFQDGEEVQDMVFADGYAPGVGQYTTKTGPAVKPNVYTPMFSDGQIGVAENVPTFWPGLSSTPHFDVTQGLGVGIFVCTPPRSGVPPGPTTFRSVCGADPTAPDNKTGVPGMTIDIVPKPAPFTWYGPTYSDGGASPLAGNITSAEGGFTTYLNAVPGDYELVLHPPPGQHLDCTPDLAAPHSAWTETDVGVDLHYKIRVQPGMLTGGVFLYCTAVP